MITVTAATTHHYWSLQNSQHLYIYFHTINNYHICIHPMTRQPSHLSQVQTETQNNPLHKKKKLFIVIPSIDLNLVKITCMVLAKVHFT